jgi:hypothetical protein
VGRFEAELPNECWQSDVTHWELLDGTEVEIVNTIDDHSRLAVASRAFSVVTAASVRDVFLEAGASFGFPAALLTDNGCVYTTWHRGGPNLMQTELLSLGIDYRPPTPCEPVSTPNAARPRDAGWRHRRREPKRKRGVAIQAR